MWRPQVDLAIPTDIPAEHRDHVRSEIDRCNLLLTGASCLQKSRAIQLAAIVLSNSAASACGIPTARREKHPAAVALGKIKSPKKAAASRQNGKLGGRPKKKPVSA